MSINKTPLYEDKAIKVLAWPKEQNCKNNPYNFILYSQMPASVVVNEFHPRKMKVRDESIFHIHWPDMLLRSRRWWRILWRFHRLQKAMKKIHHNGGKVVWTVHNLKPHLVRFPALSDWLMRKFIAHVDGLIFLTENSRNEFLILYPEFEHITYQIIPHGHYRSYYQSAFSDSAITENTVNRQDLGVSSADPLLLMFGKIRAHKGLNDLLTAKDQLNCPNLHLLIAGNPGDNGIDSKTLDRLAEDSLSHTVFEHINNEQLPSYFKAADAVILPYTDILNSGTAILALSFGTPIIAPAIGSLVSLQKQFGSDWVFLYNRPLNNKALDCALRWLSTRTASEPDLSSLDPKKISEQTLLFYQQLLTLDNQP